MRTFSLARGRRRPAFRTSPPSLIGAVERPDTPIAFRIAPFDQVQGTVLHGLVRADHREDRLDLDHGGSPIWQVEPQVNTVPGHEGVLDRRSRADD